MMIYKEYTCIYMVYTLWIYHVYTCIFMVYRDRWIYHVYTWYIHEYTTDIGQIPISYVYTMYIHKIGIPDGCHRDSGWPGPSPSRPGGCERPSRPRRAGPAGAGPAGPASSLRSGYC